MPVPGGARVQVDAGGAVALGVSDALGGLPPGMRFAARVARERCVRIG